MHENEEATQQLESEQMEEVSGRWLRDQLRDVAGDVDSPPPPDVEAEAAETSTTELIDGLAASISAAVTEPIRGLESRREAKQQQFESALQDLSGKLGEVFGEVAKLREEAASAGMRADESKETLKRELETVRGEFRNDAEQLSAANVDLRDGFNRLAEEVGRMQEKLREHHERIDALRFRETQRAKAMTELERASTSLKDALSAAAALSGPSEEEAANG